MNNTMDMTLDGAGDPAAVARKFWDLAEIRRSQLGSFQQTELLAAVAALFLIRWADHEEGEREAVAEFNGEEYRRAIPDLRWESLIGAASGPRLSLIRQLAGGPALFTQIGQMMCRIADGIKQTRDLPPRVGNLLVEWVDQFRMESLQQRRFAGAVLDHMISAQRRDAKKMYGEYVTPEAVAELMIALADPKPGERIYDPCFGSGRILLGCSRRIQANARGLAPSRWEELRQNSIYGVERNSTAYVIGLARIVLSGIDYPGLEIGNALERTEGKIDASSQFDCVLCDPPMGGKAMSSEMSHYPIQTQELLGLFIQHSVMSLRPGGRAIIHVPSSVLFRTGPDRRLRELLATHHCLEGVIGLPAGILKPYTNIATNLLVIQKREAKKSVRFLQISNLRDDESGAANPALADSPALIAQKFWHGEPNSVLWETPVAELAHRDWDLQVRRYGDDKLQQFLQAVRSADPQVQRVALSDVAEVINGVTYNKADTSNERSGDMVGLIRVADVTGKGIKEPGLYMKPGVIKNAGKKSLKTGDVLVTSGGTIGKVGLIGAKQIGSVPSKSLIFLRCSERVLPEYINATLRSEVYREWLVGHAMGSVIKNLSSRTLAHLEIPLPPLPLQRRIADACTESDRDAARELLRILVGEGPDPLTEWLDSPEMSAVRRWQRDSAEVAPEQLLELAARSVSAMRNRSVHASDGSWPERAQPLLVGLDAGLKQLIGLNRIPLGPVRYSILERAAQSAQGLETVLGESSGGWEEGLLQTAQALRLLALKAMQPMLAMKAPVLSVEPSEIAAGTTTDVSLVVQNSNVLPFRSVTIFTDPDIGRHTVEYIDANTHIRLPLSLPSVQHEGRFDFRVNWTGKRIDGFDIAGDAQLVLEVKSGRDAQYKGDLGESPYNGQDAVDRPEMFKGRELLVRRIRAELAKPQPAKVILLEGNRRMGKTSILNRVIQEPPAGWLPVYCSFQGGAGSGSQLGLSDREIFRLMARQIGWTIWDAMQIKTWPTSGSAAGDQHFKKAFSDATLAAFQSDHPVEVFELYLQSVLAAIRPKRLLVLLDEFDKIQEGIAAGSTNPIVPENLRFLLKAYPGFAVVLAGSKRLKKLREDYWSALFGLGERMEVGPLDELAAEELVVEPVRDRLTYAPDAVDRLVSLCGRRPNLIQVLCNHLFFEARESGNRMITASTVESVAAEKMTHENEHFATLWSYAGTERKRLILSLCAHFRRHDVPATFSAFETELQTRGVFIPKHEKLEDDIMDLLEQEVLVRETMPTLTTYAVSVPLLETWITNNNGDLQMLFRQALREAEEKHE